MIHIMQKGIRNAIIDKFGNPFIPDQDILGEFEDWFFYHSGRLKREESGLFSRTVKKYKVKIKVSIELAE